MSKARTFVLYTIYYGVRTYVSSERIINFLAGVFQANGSSGWFERIRQKHVNKVEAANQNENQEKC